MFPRIGAEPLKAGSLSITKMRRMASARNLLLQISSRCDFIGASPDHSAHSNQPISLKLSFRDDRAAFAMPGER